MFVEQFLEWFLSPDGGAAYLGMFIASWGLEATAFWNKLTKAQKTFAVVGISTVLSAATIYVGLPAQSLAETCELAKGFGSSIECTSLLDELFTVEGALAIGAVWVWSLVVHALNPYRKKK